MPMKLRNRLLGPWGFRRVIQRFEAPFLSFILVLWFGGLGALLLVSIFELDKRFGLTLNSVALVTIWPAMIGWLGFSGITVLWMLRIYAKRFERATPMQKLLFYVWFLAGLTFIGGAVSLTVALLRGKVG